MTTRFRNRFLGAASFILGVSLLGIISVDPDAMNSPEIFVPLIIDAVLGLSAVVFFYKQMLSPGPAAGSESNGFFALALIYLLIVGLIISGLACIIGYGIRLQAQNDRALQ